MSLVSIAPSDLELYHISLPLKNVGEGIYTTRLTKKGITSKDEDCITLKIYKVGFPVEWYAQGEDKWLEWILEEFTSSELVFQDVYGKELTKVITNVETSFTEVVEFLSDISQISEIYSVAVSRSFLNPKEFQEYMTEYCWRSELNYTVLSFHFSDKISAIKTNLHTYPPRLKEIVRMTFSRIVDELKKVSAIKLMNELPPKGSVYYNPRVISYVEYLTFMGRLEQLLIQDSSWRYRFAEKPTVKEKSDEGR